jgi:phosphatidylglycerol:prolipoprotein diacylglycerol transferase
MTYAVCVVAGIALAWLVRRFVPRPSYPHAAALGAVALVGALAGALLFELPADWLGWSASIAGEPVRTHGLGGRTVLGGILGGWIAVDLSKPALGIRVPTGDGFAAPLAAALASGRIGCVLTGCCAGKVASTTVWWRDLAVSARDGLPRFPAALVECFFHGAAAFAIVLLARRGLLAGRWLAAYVAAYCVLRIALEEVRDNPPVLLGRTYYQLLAVPLFALATATLVRRRRAPPDASSRDNGSQATQVHERR